MEKMRRFVVLLAVASFLAGCSDAENQTKDTSTQVDTSEVVTKEDTSRPETSTIEVVEPETTTETEKIVVGIPEKENAPMTRDDVLDLMNDSFEGSFRVTYDSTHHAFAFMADSKGMAEEIFDVMMGVPSARREWDEMSESIRDLSESVSGALLDEDVIIAIQNPFEPEKNLLMVRNGKVLYNITEE